MPVPSDWIENKFREIGWTKLFVENCELQDLRSQARKQLEIAMRGIAWDDTRQHDDLIRVAADDRTRHEQLCHVECAKEFPVSETEWG